MISKALRRIFCSKVTGREKALMDAGIDNAFTE